MEKKVFGIRIDPKTSVRIKTIAVQHGRPIGDVVAALLEFYDRTFSGKTHGLKPRDLLSMLIINHGEGGYISGWVPEFIDGLNCAKFAALEGGYDKRQRLKQELAECD